MYEFAIVWDWLAFAVRWLHVITGIAWIGSSFYFVALDLGLKKVPHLPPGDSRLTRGGRAAADDPRWPPQRSPRRSTVARHPRDRPPCHPGGRTPPGASPPLGHRPRPLTSTYGGRPAPGRPHLPDGPQHQLRPHLGLRRPRFLPPDRRPPRPGRGRRDGRRHGLDVRRAPRYRSTGRQRLVEGSYCCHSWVAWSYWSHCWRAGSHCR